MDPQPESSLDHARRLWGGHTAVITGAGSGIGWAMGRVSRCCRTGGWRAEDYDTLWTLAEQAWYVTPCSPGRRGIHGPAER